MQALCGAFSRGLVSSHRHNPEPAFTVSFSVFPALNVGDVDADIETASPVLGFASGVGWPAPGAEGPETRQPDILAIGKRFADNGEHAVHRVPCSPLAQPVRAAKRSAISVLFMCSSPAVTPCPSAIPGRHIARFQTSTTTNSRLRRRPAAPGRRPFRRRRFADQCAPQRRLYFRPETQGSLRPTVLPNPDGSLKSNPSGYAAGPLLPSPPCRDCRHAYRLSTNSGISSGASPLSFSSSSSVRSDRPRQESLSATIMLIDVAASRSSLRAICLHTPRRSRMPRSKPLIYGSHKVSPLSASTPRTGA